MEGPFGMDLEKEDQKLAPGRDVLLMGLIQVFVLFIGMYSYMRVTRFQVESTLSLKTPKQNFVKTKEVVNTVSSEVAWNEPASAEKAIREYTEFVVTKRPWLLSLDRIIWGLCFLVPSYFFIRKIARIETAEFTDSANGRDILAGVATGFATFCFVNVASSLIFFIIGKPQSNYLEIILTKNLYMNWKLLGWTVLAIAFGAGIFEEFFFRGFLLKYFEEKNIGSIGLIITSVIFGVVHFNGGSYVAPILLIFVGLSFGISYLKTGNIWVPVTAHITYNASMLLAGFLLGDRIS